MAHRRFLLPLAVALLAGCSSRAPELRGTAQERAPEETVRSVLEGLAESGQSGSEIGQMMQALEKMKATDPAKAEALIEDANQIMKLSGPEAVKAKAKEMLAKLDGGAAPGPAAKE
jgi:cellobiose-specific phosphotransferase system component IIA